MKRMMTGLLMAALIAPAAFAQKTDNAKIQRIAHQEAEGFLAHAERSAVARDLTARDVALQLGYDGDYLVRNDRTHANGRRTIHADQFVNGLQVRGAGLVVNLDEHGFVRSTAGSLVEGASLPTEARISADLAARRSMKGLANARMASKAPQLSYVVNTKDEVVLAWMTKVEYSSEMGPHVDLVFVDALTGKMAARHPQVMYARNLNTKDCNETTTNCGTVSTSSNNINTGDLAIDSAHNYAIATYNYYANNHGRDSINDNGMTLVSNVHYDRNYNNAYWWNNEMTYGDGDGTTFAPLSQDADVVAHELTHGVTETSSNLVYANESGALNEAWSDIFGALVDYQEGATGADIWLVGEDIYTPNGSSSDALRYMANPTQDGYSTDYYPTRLYSGNCSPSNNNDQCGVHGNSGIANLAFKLLVDGGSHPRGVTSTVVPGIGFAAAGDIFYYANTQCMTSSSNFEAARNCTVAGATTQAHKDAVNAAWDAVGVPGGGSTPPPSGGGELTNGVVETGLSGSTSSETDFFMDVPAGATDLSFQMSGGSGDADLYVRFGSAPTTSSYDCRPYLNGNSETCSFASPSAGTYYVMVRAYSSYSNVSLVGSFTASGPNQAPTAGFTSSVSDLTASFTNTSSDSDGSIASSSWNFGDGSTSSATSPSHTYGVAGTYNVTLTVTDNDGATDSFTNSVTVTAPTGGCSDSVTVDLPRIRKRKNKQYTFDVPACANTVTFNTSGGSGDLDLFVRFGGSASRTNYDCASEGNGNNETCTFTPAQAGTYHIYLYAYSTVQGAALTASYE